MFAVPSVRQAVINMIMPVIKPVIFAVLPVRYPVTNTQTLVTKPVISAVQRELLRTPTKPQPPKQHLPKTVV